MATTSKFSIVVPKIDEPLVNFGVPSSPSQASASFKSTPQPNVFKPPIEPTKVIELAKPAPTNPFSMKGLPDFSKVIQTPLVSAPLASTPRSSSASQESMRAEKIAKEDEKAARERYTQEITPFLEQTKRASQVALTESQRLKNVAEQSRKEIESQGLSYNATSGQSPAEMNLIRESNLLENTVKNIDKIFDRNKDKGNFLERVKLGASEAIERPEKLLPFLSGAIGATDAAEIVGIVRKQQRGEKLSDSERLVLSDFQFKMLKDQLVDSSAAEQIGMVLATMPTYAAEFGLTGGSYATVKTATEAALSAAPKLIARSVGALAGAAVQTVAGFTPRVAQSTAQYMTPEFKLARDEGDKIDFEISKNGDSFGKALAKGFGTNFIEVLTERMGGLIEGPSTKVMDGLKKGILGEYLTKMGLSEKTAALKHIQEKIGWNGILGEVFEEELSNLGQAPIEGRKINLPFVTEEGTKRFLVELGGSAGFSGIMKLGEDIASGKGGMSIKDVSKDLGANAGSGIAKELAMEEAKKSNVPPELEPLAQEARKYKSAEEFVKAQTPVHRGLESNPAPNRIQEGATPEYTGTAFSRDKVQAQKYGDLMLSKYIPENAILKPEDISPSTLKQLRAEWSKLDPTDADSVPTEKIITKVMDIAKREGKGAADIAKFFPTMGEEAEIRVLNSDALKTKSQLTDFYNQATQVEAGTGVEKFKTGENPEDVIGDVFGELSNSQAGQRLYNQGEVTGIPSTFPKWLPEGLRTRKLIDSFQDKLFNGGTMTQKEASLMETVRQRIAQELNTTPESITDGMLRGKYKAVVAQEAYEATVANGGVTISLEGNKPASGIAFSPFKDAEYALPTNEVTPEIVSKYMEDHAEQLNMPGNHLGMWESDGKIYLDISRVGEGEAALEDAMQNNQLAAFDLSTFKEVPLGNIDETGYHRLYEKASDHPHLNQGKETGASSEGSTGQSQEVSESQGQETTPKEGEVKPKTKERKFITSVKEEFPNMGDRVAGDYIPRSTDDLSIQASNLIKDDIAAAEDLAMTGTDENAVATASELIKHYNELAEKAGSNTPEGLAMYDKAAEVVHAIAPKLTELGRAVQAASILGRMTPEGQLRFAARTIQKHNDAVKNPSKRLPQLTGEQTGEILRQAKEIENMEDGTEKAIKFKKLQDFISDLIPSTWYQKAIALWKAGLLTGMKTTGTNVLANLFHGVSEIAKDAPAAAVDSVLSLFTGERTMALTGRGALKGIKEGFQKGWQYIKTGYDERNVSAKLDYHRVNFGNSKVGKALQAYEETIFKILGAEDQPFYYGAKAHSLMSQAIAQAKNKGLKGEEAKEFINKLVEQPTDDMLRYAVNDAEMAVFQNKTVLGAAAKGIQNIPGVGQVVLPFGRTPAAAAMQIINYSPVGIVKTIISSIGKGRFDQRMFSQGIGRGVVGSGVMAIGMALLSAGMMALDRPTSEREINQWELEGKKPNSIKIGGKWRSPTVLGPLGYVLIMGGQLQKAIDETGSLSAALPQAGLASLKGFTEQTFLTGLNQFTNALNDPDRYATNVVGNLIGSSIPTIIADIARATDSKDRLSTASKVGFFGPLKSRIPGVRQTLETKVDALGNEMQRVGNIFEVMADPTRPSTIKSNALVEELRRLIETDHNITPTDFGTDKKYKEVLSDEEMTRLQIRAGAMLESKLTNLIASEKYKNLDDEGKEKIIRSFTDIARVIARAEVVQEKVKDLQGDDRKKEFSKLKAAGIMTKEVYEKWQELF